MRWTQGIVPAGEDAQSILYEPNQDEEADITEALSQLGTRYNIDDFDVARLTRTCSARHPAAAEDS